VARAEEGAGVVVATLIVAARNELLDLTNPHDADELRMALRALSAMQGNPLVALEVVWSPAEENVRMSTAEQESLSPELSRLDTGSAAGRVFCASCGGPYATELGECPHCGAPRPAEAG